MYVYTRHLVSENYPTGEDTSKYKIIVKRYRFWESNTLSTIYLQILLLALISTGYGVSSLGTFILKLGDILLSLEFYVSFIKLHPQVPIR